MVFEATMLFSIKRIYYLCGHVFTRDYSKCFQFFLVVNNAAMNISVHLLISVSKLSEMELLREVF